MSTHLIILHVIAILIPGEEYGLLSNFLHLLVSFYLLGLHIPLSTLILNHPQ
jgi:hypothetical protein